MKSQSPQHGNPEPPRPTDNDGVKPRIGNAAEPFRKDAAMRTLLESLGQGVVVVDTTGHILLVNSRASEMFGYPEAEMVGRHHDMVIPQRLQQVHGSHMSNYFYEPKIRPMGQGLDLVATRKDRSEFPVEISLSFVEFEDSLLVIALITDITLRVESQKALAQHAKELANTNEALKAFSYSVSHDLRGPLQTLMGFTRILIEDYADRLDEEGREYLQRMLSTGNRMNQLIKDMLSLSRVSRQDMAIQDIDLRQMAESIIEELRRNQPMPTAQVSIQENLRAKGDPGLVRMILTNLIGNAWKYSAKTPDPRIEIGSLHREAHTTFFVRDNGVGFDMQYASKLFSPFQRLHTSAEFAGTGIGLATAARAVSRHGGRIWAESSPGKGAVFYFELD